MTCTSGQSLVEVVVALGLGAILIGSAVVGITFMLRAGAVNLNLQLVSVLNQSELDAVHSVAGSNWLDIYNLTKGSDSSYYLVASGTALFVLEGKEGVLGGGGGVGLAGHWNFDEKVGSVAYDSAGNGNHGVLVGSSRSPSCRVSSCLYFDGVTNHVLIPDSSAFDFDSGVTVAAWINAGDVSDRVIVSKSDGASYAWELGISTDGKLVGGVNSNINIAQSSSTVPVNTWVNAAMTFDESQVKVYLDGVLEGVYSYAAGILNNNISVSIGRSMSVAPAYFSGYIDDVRVYNRALGDNEVSSLYRSSVFTRYFYVEDVMRNGDGDIVDSGGVSDPSTEKITVVTEWSSGGSINSIGVSDYVTRWRNSVFHQTDWLGGGGVDGPVVFPGDGFSNSTDISVQAGSIQIKGL